MAKGDLIYAKEGRAFVRGCRLEQSTDDTFRRNARALRAFAHSPATHSRG